MKTIGTVGKVVFSILVVWAFVDAILSARNMPTIPLKLYGFFGSLILSLLFIGALGVICNVIVAWRRSRHQ